MSWGIKLTGLAQLVGETGGLDPSGPAWFTSTGVVYGVADPGGTGLPESGVSP